MADNELALKAILDTGDFDAGMQIITGAMRQVGAIAVDAFMAAGKAVAGFVSDSFQGALEDEQTLARLAQVIKSTGEAAGVTLDDAKALASQFSTLAGGSDDAVLSIIDMGLRMGTVSEKDMPGFIQATLDLTAVMGDAQKASMIMSQAFDDPVGTLGRLRKAGILVKKSVEDQMKAMVKAGDTAGAYKLLMNSVGEATAGAAEAMQDTALGQWQLFTTTLEEAGATVMTAFIPSLMTLFNAVIAPAIPMIIQLSDALSSMVTAFLSANDPLTILQNSLSAVISFLQPIIDAAINMASAFQTSIPMVRAAVTDMANFLTTTFNTLSPTLVQNVSTMLNQIGIFWKAHGQEIMVAVDIAFRFITATVGGALTLLSGLIAATLQLINGDWDNAWATIVSTAQTFMQLALNIVGVDLDDFLSTWNFIMESVVFLVSKTWNDIITFLATGLSAWSDMWGMALTIVVKVFGNIQTAIGMAITGIINSIQSVINKITDFVNAILSIPSLPSWMTPGSPTPLEMGLWGINDALKAVTLSMPAMSASIPQAGVTNNTTHNVNLNMGGVTLAGNMDAQAFQSQLITALNGAM